MGSSGGGGGGDSQTTIRYAPYIESKHQSFLNTVASARSSLIGASTGAILSFQEWIGEQGWSLPELLYKAKSGVAKEEYNEYVASFSEQNQREHSSPFASYTDIEVDSAFFGLGYLISSFPSLYDMFGKHMAGLDVENTWDGTFERLFDAPNTNANILENMKIIDDEIVKGDLAEYQVSMRNINAISTSSFIVGKAVGEDKRLKLLSKMSLEAKVNLLDSVGKEYIASLNWNKLMIVSYANIMKDYFLFTSMIDDVDRKSVV